MIKRLRNFITAQWLLLLALTVFVPVSFAEISHVSAGNRYTCIINDGAVECGGENTCPLFTSDAAHELPRVDYDGRRIL